MTPIDRPDSERGHSPRIAFIEAHEAKCGPLTPSGLDLINDVWIAATRAARTPPVQPEAVALPPLPAPAGLLLDTGRTVNGYRHDQMHAYARAAIEAASRGTGTTLLRAAEILEREAECLSRSYIVSTMTSALPVWDDQDAKRDHDEMLAIAAELRKGAL